MSSIAKYIPSTEMLDSIEDRARKINPDISLDRSTYTKQKDPCRWIDSKIGEFYRTPNAVINGSAFHPSTLEKRKKAASLARYGVENPAQNDGVISKIKETIRKKYGDGGHMKNEEIVDRYKATMNERYGVDYPAENQDILKKQQVTNLERYGHKSSLKNADVIQKINDTNIERYGSISPVQNPEIKEKMQKTNLERYGVSCASQGSGAKEKTRKTNLERYGQECAIGSPAVRAKIVKTMLDRYGSESPGGSYEIQKKVHQKQKNTGPEIYLTQFLTNAGIDVRGQYFLNGKMWDLAIFKNNQLDLIIEIDGEYHHSLTSDPCSSKNAFVPDDTRYSRLPENVKFLTIDSQKVKKSFPEISRLLNMDCSEQVNEIIISLVGTPFPFPIYDSKRLNKDWSNLCKMDADIKCNNKLMPANSLITYFHKSIYSSKVGKNSSPVEAWSDEKLLRKCVENRFIYASSLSSQVVARGFERSKIAPRVTVFQPYLARWLLQTYAPEARVVIDPFSGFSGRMLGAVSLGMEYHGSDIRAAAIEESEKLVDFLKLEKAFVKEGSVDTVSLPDADVLITCPPYGNKEVWFQDQDCKSADAYIDMCLSRFKARTYIFVIDKTDKYSQFVRMLIDRTSHMSSSSKELVLVIEKTPQ